MEAYLTIGFIPYGDSSSDLLHLVELEEEGWGCWWGAALMEAEATGGVVKELTTV